MKTDLSKYNNNWYDPGAGSVKRVFWFLINAFFISSWFPGNGFKIFLLRAFGAKVGKDVIIKPKVNIKYPWKLQLGNHVWIGEDVWIDNLGEVKIGDDCCVSQGALLLTGNHNFKKSTFDLIVEPIILADAVWIGAKSVVCPGVTCGTHSVLTVGSVANKDLESFSIYQGNPAVKIKQRQIGL